MKTDKDEDGVMFAQDGERVERRKCYNCGKVGHLGYQCPDKKDDDKKPGADEEQLHTMMSAVEVDDGSGDDESSGEAGYSSTARAHLTTCSATRCD